MSLKSNSRVGSVVSHVTENPRLKHTCNDLTIRAYPPTLTANKPIKWQCSVVGDGFKLLTDFPMDNWNLQLKVCDGQFSFIRVTCHVQYSNVGRQKH